MGESDKYKRRGKKRDFKIKGKYVFNVKYENIFEISSYGIGALFARVLSEKKL